ncbi:MAG: DNA internalization-related competence protein ComEC/Rec2 [Gemmatimonadales bacterium]|nr:DNA internalization-related competence protein ComEC/Rec2 [Gemmatimonadales bacterium]
MKPPPAILFTAVYGAGLATGLLRVGGPIGVTAVALAAGATGRPLPVLLAAAGLLGRLSGEIAWASEKGRCPGRLPQGKVRLMVRVLEPVDSTGGRLALQPLRARCTGAVDARWAARKPVAAGVDAAIEGRWLSRAGLGGRPGGTLIVTKVGAISGHPSPGARLRNSLFRASRSLYGARAPMVDALILGRRGGIDPELQDRFARSGLVHLLSISGFHVGLITAWVFLLARLLGISRSRSLMLSAAVSAAYVAFLGWPAPAARAAALAAVVARCQVRQRLVQANALLAATCLCVLVVDPWAILDLGGWLSAAALWGASTFSRWSDRALGEGFWWRTLASSLGATLATAPITATALGTVAVAGIGLNFAAIPLAAVAVPGVLASLLLQPVWSESARAMAAGAGLALHLLELAAGFGAAIPWGHVLVEPGDSAAAVPWLGALVMALWAMGSRNTPAEAARRAGWALAAALWLMLARGGLPGSADGEGQLALHFLDVGQGDGAVLRTPGGRWVVIDAGPAGERNDAGRRVVVPFLMRQGARSLAAVIISHAHADHLGGVPSVLRRFRAGVVVEPGALVADPLYAAFLADLAGTSVAWHPGRAGERFTIDSVSFTVLHPDPLWTGWGEDVNEDSVVLLVEYGAFQALFAGDAGFPAEAAMRRRLGAVDLLKVGHHGSRGSTGDGWLGALRPRAAVISVGRNDYGHPAPETLGRLARHGVDVRRTDLDGTVTVTSDGQRMTVRGAMGSVEYDVR